MNSKRLYIVLLAAIGVGFIALIGGAYEANNVLSSKAAELTSLKAKNQALMQAHLTLTKSKKEVQQYADLEKITSAVVPEDKSQAEAVREIVNIAKNNDVSLGSISFPASTLGTGPAGTATTTPVPVTPKTGKLSQLVPVKNIPGVYQLVIAVQGDPDQSIPYSKFIAFLSDLEQNRHTAQVSTITITPDPNDNDRLTFNLSLNEYIKP